MRRALTLLLAAACGGPRSAECDRYLACAEAAAPLSTRNQAATYGPNGTCWANESDAAACAELCEQALLAVRADAGRTTPQCQ